MAALSFCTTPLVIVLVTPSGVQGGMSTLSLSLGTRMRVYMEVGARGKVLSFRVFHFQLRCQYLKSITIFWVFIIFPRLRVIFRHHNIFPLRCKVPWMYQYWHRLPPFFAVSEKRYYLPCMVVLNNKLPRILCCLMKYEHYRLIFWPTQR